MALALGALGLAGGAWASGTTTTTHPATRPPFFHGKAPPVAGAVGLLPVSVAQRAPGIPEAWLPRAALEALGGDVEEWLAGLAEVRLPAIAGGPRAAPPHVYLGCAPDAMSGDDCEEEERANVLAVTSGSREWRAALAEAAAEGGVERILLLELEVAAHWIRQRNLRGAKEIWLGTGRAQPLPWLTSLDTPIYVLQLGGVVTGAEGKIQRAGVEGLWALRTPFRASTLGAQKLLQAEDVERVRTSLRVGEAPDAPLVWQVAARRLVEQLLGSLPSPGAGR